MRRLVMLLLLVLLPSISWGQVIDVTIKGVDDGIRTNRQQDYNEALLNAKLQAIERAGVEIESIVKIVNFQLKFQAVESKAKAVLMPGFQVVDIGYTSDGTYQVVLVGKVQTGREEDKGQRIGHFVRYPNGTALDTRTNLMWMTEDFYIVEGRGPTNWEDIVKWVDRMNSIAFGGYRDWRLPSIREYKAIFDHEKQKRVLAKIGEVITSENRQKYFGSGLPEAFEYTGGGNSFCSSERDGNSILTYNFTYDSSGVEFGGRCNVRLVRRARR